MKIRLVLTGRAYHVAESLPEELDLPDGASLDDALSALGKLLPDEAALPGSCLIAIGGQHLGTVASHGERSLSDGDELMLIAPVAGG